MNAWDSKGKGHYEDSKDQPTTPGLARAAGSNNLLDQVIRFGMTGTFKPSDLRTTIITTTKAQNEALPSQTLALTKLKHVRKCLRKSKSPADNVRASVGILEV
jgi:hypothetical protein